MHWKKLGRIFTPENHPSWFVSHAALPVAEYLHDDLWRIYFSGRDGEGRAQIGYFDIDIKAPNHILNVSDQPIIRYGELGTFDDRGATASCLVHHNDQAFFYYSGWHLGVTVPFYFFIGLAIRGAGETDFKKYSQAPVMGRHSVDPYLLGSPYILVENETWRMWYVSAVRWEQHGDEQRHYYLIKYAESSDGIHWDRDNTICIDFKDDNEYALARPHVIKENDIYRMWYSYRGENYRIGYAESSDGIHWERKDDHVGIDVSASGWDAEMITYPFIFDHDGQRYMLYNGNGYGKSGIGLAILQSKGH